MNISSALECHWVVSPHSPAIIHEGAVCSYEELAATSGRLANGLRSAGIRKGDRVGLFLPNTPEFVLAYFGILKAGAVAVSLSPALEPGEAAFLLRDCGAKALVTSRPLAATLPLGDLPGLERVWSSIEPILEQSRGEEYAEPMSPGEPAVIVYSSGTTGIPKGATLSHGNVIFNTQAKQRYLGIRPEDRLLLFLPLHHCFGQNAILNAGLGSGAAIVLLPRFDPEAILQSIAGDRVTMFFGVPAAFLALFDRATPRDMQSVRYYFSAAAPLPFEIERKWREKFGEPIHQGYGLTETSPFVSYNHESRIKPGSIGTPIEGVDMKIVSLDDGCEAAPGEPGEIAVRGPNVMLGYWNRPDESAQAIRDGWFHTGDIGRRDEEGYFFIEDRLKDMINVGGLKVYPAEVENALYRHPAVAEAAVYGARDAYLGEQVHARVVLRAGASATARELIGHCRGQVSSYKTPASVEFASSLPKSPAGKVLKRVLRSESSGAGKAIGALTGDALQAWLARWFSTRLQVEAAAFDLDRPFAELGLDSMLALSMAHDLGERLGRPLEPTIAWRFATPRALIAHLAPADGAPDDDANDAHDHSGLMGLPEAELARQLAEEIAAVRQHSYE